MTVAAALNELKKENYRLKRRIMELELFALGANSSSSGGDHVAQLLERLKELNCLYEISRLAVDKNNALEDIFRKALETVKSSWQYPDAACVRIIFDNMHVETAGYEDTPWRQSADVFIDEKRRGSISVCYNVEKPARDEGPFLKEERRLIDTLARELAIIAEHKLLLKSRQESEERYSTLIENASDGVFIIQTGAIRFANNSFMEMLGCSRAENISENVFFKFIADEYLKSNAAGASRAPTQPTRELFGLDLMRRNGTRIEVELAVNLITYNGKPAVMGIVRDVTAKKNLEKKIVDIGEHERRLIGQELHDGTCQQLAGIAAASSALQAELPRANSALREKARMIQEIARKAMDETKNMAKRLNPVEIRPEGLMTALSELAYSTTKLYEVNCRFTCSAPILIDNTATATQLYRISQEAVNNAVKHAHADSITISLLKEKTGIILQIRDNGVGIQEKSGGTGGMGLNIMHYRARMMGTTLVIESTPGQGTSIKCTLPALSRKRRKK
jgi:PAS domain S-box-containing protein